MAALIQSGISIFGFFNMDPSLLAFLLAGILFGGLNLLEYKRLD